MDGSLELRARARRDSSAWAETPWQRIESSDLSIDVEWRRSLEETEDGLLRAEDRSVVRVTR